MQRILDFRNNGLYIKCLGKVIVKDIPRFLSVFIIILMTFTISFYLAIRGYQPIFKERQTNKYVARVVFFNVLSP